MGLELGTHQECAAKLSIETVRLLRWRGQSVGEHDGDQRSDGGSNGLLSESIWSLVAEWTWCVSSARLLRTLDILATRAIESRCALTIIW
jgi:hypothetical protein